MQTWGRRRRAYVGCVLLWSLLAGLSGCGYTVVGAPQGGVPATRLPLHMAPFTNQTREPDLERLTTLAVRQALAQSALFVYADAPSAAPRLQGVIRRFRSFPLAFDSRDSAVQYRLEADMTIRLTEASAERPLLEQELSAAAVYFVAQTSADRVRADVTAREAAITRLTQQFADQCLALLATTLL